MKIPNKRRLHQTAWNYLPDSKVKDFVRLYKDFTKKSFSCLVSNTNLPSDNPSRFRKYLL